MTFKVGVLASTNGTDLQAIFEEMRAGTMPGIEVSVVVSNVEGCGALEKARTRGVRAVFIDPKNKSKEEFDRELIAALKYVDLVCLIGYMKILSPEFIKAFEGRILNVHPALLPKYGGKGFYGQNVHEAVLKNQEIESGMTIHYVTEDVDGGPILIQKKVQIEAGENPESLKAKVQELEKKYYPEAIRIVYNKGLQK